MKMQEGSSKKLHRKPKWNGNKFRRSLGDQLGGAWPGFWLHKEIDIPELAGRINKKENAQIPEKRVNVAVVKYERGETYGNVESCC